MTRTTRTLAAASVYVVALVVTVPAVTGVGVAAATSTPPECVSVDFSPAFALDRKGFCVAFDPSDGDSSTYRFFTTRDGGRTFERRPATGLTTTADDRIGSVIVSPGYETDRTVFVQTSGGVFATSDDGDTFTLLDNFATPGPSGPNLSVYQETSPSPGAQTDGPRPVLVLAAGDGSMKIDPPLRIPVAGAPLEERRFLFPSNGLGEWSAYTMTVEIDRTAGRSRNVLFACDQQLVCNEQLFAFPWGYQFEPRGGIWFAPDFDRSGRVYVVSSKVFDGTSSLRAWRSTDGGATFERWRSVERMLQPLRRLADSRPLVGLALHPSRPRTIYMRLGYSLSVREDAEGTPPTERFLVSRDRGRTWSRLAHQRDDRQEGSRGAIPWDGTWGFPVQNHLSLTEDGTLFVLAKELGGHSGLYCSVDGGRNWAPLCPSE